jgi:uncharacterized membrane protein
MTMPSFSHRSLSSIGIAASTMLTLAAIAQPSLTWIGTPLQVADASEDGNSIIGKGGSQTFTGTDPSYYWSATGGLVQLTTQGAGNIVNRAAASGISGDGQVVIGWLYNAPSSNMFFPVAWNASALGTIATFLTPANATGRGEGRDISADGTLIASIYELSTPPTTSAFIRNAAGGAWTPLDTPSSQRRFLTVLLSRSAQHACGGFTTGISFNTRGYVWSATTGFADIGVPAGFASFTAATLSDDGRVVAGNARVQNPPAQSALAPFVWTQGSGYRMLPLPSPAVTGLVGDVTSDGVLASGHVADAINFANARAVVWTPQGVLTVAQLATNAGVSVTNLSFLTADVIAADGSFIIGSGSRRVGANVVLDTYILRNIFIPRCDTIDFNRNGVFPEDQDVIDFFSVFSGGACSTGAACGDIDFNNNAMFPEDQDVVDFFDALAGGAC